MNYDTKLKLSLSSVGLNVKVFGTSNNFVKEFSSIRKTAKYFDISSSTIQRIINKKIFYKGFLFKSENKDNRIIVYNCQ